jgi:hypothetical protein
LTGIDRSIRRAAARDNRAMSAHPDDQTPLARLNEAGMHHIVGYQLAQAAITTLQVFTERVGEPFELRPVEFTMLSLIHENPDVSARQLARALAVTPPNITVWIDRLEKRGGAWKFIHRVAIYDWSRNAGPSEPWDDVLFPFAAMPRRAYGAQQDDYSWDLFANVPSQKGSEYPAGPADRA